MTSKILQAALFSILLSWNPVSAVEVKFFYSPLKDSCAWGGANTFPATNNTANGGVCAFVPSRNRLFACPAPDPNCWGFNVNCLGGTTETPGDNQILCGKSNARQWCCGEAELCTTTPNQINVCIPNDFTNPNSGISPASAAAKEFSALPSASIVTNLPQSTPSVFSTLSPSTSSTSKTSANSASKSSSGDGSNASAGAAGNTVGGNTNTSSGISGGAIAGIVIGAILGTLAVVALVAFIMMRRRRQNKAVAPNGGLYEKPSDMDNSAYAPSAATSGHPQHGSGYYGPDVYAKTSAPLQHHMEPPMEPQELPVYTKPQELP